MSSLEPGGHTPWSAYAEGLEIGTVSAKWVQINGGREKKVQSLRHEGNPRQKIQEIFEHHSADGSPIVVTGQAARVLLDLPYRPETECLERGLAHHALKPDILLSLGGETFVVYTLKGGKIRNIISSSKCAAGTGEFIVQQFQRMGLTLQEGIRESCAGCHVELATRCSVHCKSDATHKLNKGECKPADIAKSLVHDLARKVCKMVDLAQWPTDRIVLAGGVSLNLPFVESLGQLLEHSEIRILPESPYLEAFGAALLAAESSRSAPPIPRDKKRLRDAPPSLEVLAPLKAAEPLLDYRVRPSAEKQVRAGASYILGLDAGSTTTKAVLLDVESGAVDASCYLRTHGNPIQAARNCLEELLRQAAGKPFGVVQAATTGSGREMVSVYLDGCLSFNEILSHARAAAEEIPEVDTVFEIGGQDSKFISFLDGIPIDYAMNEGCSAGTGSFLEESVSTDMGIPLLEISRRAEASDHPIAFGERCAAFINTDLRNAIQLGALQDDVVAGLVYSIADNYISRIVGVRAIGDTLLFQGGVALNRAVALAMAARTRRRVVVPRHPELMGAVGCALMARDLLKDGHAASGSYALDDLSNGSMEQKGTFPCGACENKCEIQRIAVRGKTYPFGGLCSRFEQQRHKRTGTKEGVDLVAARNKLMFEEFGPRKLEKPRGAIGLPLALTSYAYFPFYASLVNGLGYDVVLSEPSKEGNARTRAAICYPCEVVHGHVHDLLSRGVEHVFLPHVIEGEIRQGYRYGFTCPSTAIIPGLVRGAFDGASEKILAPEIGFSADLRDSTIQGIGNLGPSLGVDRSAAEDAARNAFTHYEHYQSKVAGLVRAELERLVSEPTVIVAGRPYVACSAELNLALPRKITSRGYHVVTPDMLPHIENNGHPKNLWHFTQQITNAIAYAKQHRNMYVCLVSCFSCIPDAVMYHLFREELAGRVFCYLEIDSHTAHAGFETRVGAFLDIIEERRRKES